MSDNPYLSLVLEVAQTQKIDPILLQAICETESGWVPWRARYEPAWSYLWFPRDVAGRLGITDETETQLQKFSYGLCQVMGSVIREYGFTGHLTQVMADPKIPLQYGAIKIRKLMERYGGGSEPEIISAYNAGTARKMASGMFFNQQYVDKVSAVLHRIRQLN